MASGGSEDRPPSRGRSRPITLYLFALAVVALVPAFIFSAYLLARNNEAQARVLSSLTIATTQAIAGAVDRQLDGLGITLRVLESSNVLAEESLAAFHARASRALAGTGAYLLVLNSDGDQLLNTRVAFGTELSPTSNRQAARQAIDNDTQVISGVFYGQTAETWVFNVIRPIPLQPSGARAMLLTQNAVSLASALTTREFPADWSVAIVDSDGLIINASGDLGLTAGDPFPLAVDSSPGRQGTWQNVDVDGRASTAVYWNVANAGWRVVAWAPESAVQRPLVEAFWSLLAGGILLSAAVVLVIYWVSLRIGRSVHGLEEDARLLGAGEAVPVRSYPVSEIATVSAALAEASRRRKAAETEVRLLMRELAHRSKNQLTVIVAMAKQSAKLADSLPDFVAGFERRLFSLARSTDLLLAHGPAGIDLREVFARQVDPLCPLESGRITLDGPPLTISTQAAQILGMAAHELAANAARYGAFASPSGQVAVTWKTDADTLEIVWRERAAAIVVAGERRGFGTTVLETMVSRSLGAEVARTFHADGVEWRAVIPLAALDVHAGPDAAADEPAGEK